MKKCNKKIIIIGSVLLLTILVFLYIGITYNNSVEDEMIGTGMTEEPELLPQPIEDEMIGTGMTEEPELLPQPIEDEMIGTGMTEEPELLPQPIEDEIIKESI